MPFAIADIELSEPLPALQLAPDENGLGILLRESGRPRAFFMEALAGGSHLSQRDVEALVAQHRPAGLFASLDGASPDDVQRLPTLTVTVCTHEHAEDLTRCLNQLLRVRSGRSDVEILVIDNAPVTSRTRDVVEAFEDIRYIVEPKPGLNFARNRAIREATGDLIAFVDDDVVVDRGWLSGLARARFFHPDAAAVTGLVLPMELRTEAQIVFERYGGFEKAFEIIRYGPKLSGHPFYPCVGGKFGTGCNMSFVREVVLALGGFDDALDAGAALPGGGDTDMLYRVVRAGYPLVYEPSFMVWHRHRRERSQLRRQYCWSWGQGLMAFVTKTYQSDPEHRGKLRRLVSWWFANELSGVARSIARRDRVEIEIHLAQLWGGIVGLCGSYQRSVRRTSAIRSRYARPNPV